MTIPDSSSSTEGRKVGQMPLFLGSALLLVAVFLVYWPAIHGGPVWDDDYMFTDNPVMTQHGGLYRIFFDLTAVKVFYPVTTATLWLECRWFGLHDLTGYHIVNALIHAGNAILLWRLLRQLQTCGAFLAAALFALHPLQVESVAWITEHKNTLSGLFYILAMWGLLRHRGLIGATDDSTRRWFYAGALAAFLLALGAKTTVTTFPAAALLLIWWKTGRIRRVDVWLTLPFFLLSIVGGVLTQWVELHTTGTWDPRWSLTPPQQILVAGRALWFYAGKLVWPVSLSFAYPRWNVDPVFIWQWVYPLGAGAVITLLWSSRKRIGRGPLAAVLFFAGTLTPALGFFHVLYQRYSFVADHFQYLACIGPLVLVAAAVHRLPKFQFAISACILLAAGVTTTYSARRFTSDETVWAAALDVDPANPNANCNYGSDMIDHGQLDEAEHFLKQAILSNPKGGLAWAGLGRIAEIRRQYDRAMNYYARAVELEPSEPRCRFQSGNLLVIHGDFAAALNQYRVAEEYLPDWPELHDNLGVCLLHLNQIDAAEVEFNEAQRLSPALPLVQKHLAELRAARH